MRKLIPVLVLLIYHCTTTYAQHTYVFLGSYNWDKSKEGMYVYELDTTTGHLTRKTVVKGIHNPSFITLSPNGRFLYACTESKTPNAGSVSSFAFDAQNQSLTFLNSQPSGGENPVYVSVHKNGKWLINANYTGGSMSVYPINPDGTIGLQVQNTFYNDSGVNKARQDHAHIHTAVFSPAGDLACFTDLGADKIRCYRFEASRTSPLQTTDSFVVHTFPGSGPRHMTFHPTKKIAYLIEEMGGAISVYKYGNGRLDSIQRIYTHDKSLTDSFESSDVHIPPDGKFLYATNRGKENNIAIFSIQSNGSLKPVGYQSTFGNHPRTFAIDPAGNFLIVTNVVSHSVTVFKRNSHSGMLTKVHEETGCPTYLVCRSGNTRKRSTIRCRKEPFTLSEYTPVIKHLRS